MKNAKIESTHSHAEGVNDYLDLIFRDRIRCRTLISAAIHHELYTPLVIIRGLAESLMRKPDRDPQSHLREISKEADHLLKVLDAMIFKDPGIEIKLQSILLRKLVEQAALFFEKICLEKGISMRIEIDEHLHVFSEPVRLKNIIISLLENAVESFTDQKIAPIKSITIHAESTKDSVHLVVSDTGTGISIENQLIIQQELAMGAASMDLKNFLSLALSKKLADDLKIKMSFISEKARGTSFTLSFSK